MAALAGVPRGVIRNAEKHLAELESADRAEAGPQLGLFETAPTEDARANAPDPLREALAELEADDLTPRQALEAIYRLKGLADTD